MKFSKKNKYIKPLTYIYFLHVEDTITNSSSSLLIVNPDDETSPLIEDWVTGEKTNSGHNL